MQPDCKNINLTIDGVPVSVPEGTTILDAAKKVGVKIPTLCHHPDLKVRATCRVCVVEVKGQRKYKTACSTEVWEGAEVITNSPGVQQARKTVLELILAEHPQACLGCHRNMKCELQALTAEMGLTNKNRLKKTVKALPLDDCNGAIVRDPSKCIQCGRCTEMCQEVQTVGAITTANRSMSYDVTTAFGKKLRETTCVYCGQCTTVCPVGALYEHDDTAKVWAALADPEKHVIVQTAPSVRVAIGDEFGLPAGTFSEGHMVAALRRIGFDKVFDTNWSADVTIMEEGHELIHRLTNKGVLPMITSCSPGWIKFIETFYPDMLPHLSTAKSPQQMFGALVKTFYAEKAGIDPAKIVSVSVMPCTAKKIEAARPEMNDSGYRDVDIVITTRELARMIRRKGLDFCALPEERFDDPMGEASGAGVIFGTSGGVMEAALRTVYEVVTKKELKSLDFKAVRGHQDMKAAEVDLDGTPVKVVVVSGLKNARKILREIREGKADYQFVEVMCCPGGCVGGGGQPVGTVRKTKANRMDGLYTADRKMDIRQSHKNPAVITMYKDYLGEPLGEKAHHLLHTHYTPREQQ